MLQPERTIEPWRVRNVIRWCRPNPPVGALGDKFRPATSDMVVACVSGQRWFDLDAVRTEHALPVEERHDGQILRSGNFNGRRSNPGQSEYYSGGNPAGAPPLDHWIIPTEPYKSSHYATWPRALLTRPIQAMCPTRVCVVCGEPSRRITEPTEEYAARRDARNKLAAPYVNGSNATNPERLGRGAGALGAANSTLGKQEEGKYAQLTTLGWTDCGHGPENKRNGIVLDPFAGSGTTLAVATGHGRDAIGIDLDERNLELARDRVGPMWFTEGSPFIEGAA
jgi:hypothetical protein